MTHTNPHQATVRVIQTGTLIVPAESSNGSGDAPEATSEAQRILAAAQGR